MRLFNAHRLDRTLIRDPFPDHRYHKLILSNRNRRCNSSNLLTLLFSLLVLVLTGCGGKTIDEDTLAKTYADLIIAADTVGAATPIEEVKAKVFKKNGVTESDYNNSLSLYNEDPERWEAFFDKAIAYLESQRIEKKDSL